MLSHVCTYLCLLSFKRKFIFVDANFLHYFNRRFIVQYIIYCVYVSYVWIVGKPLFVRVSLEDVIVPIKSVNLLASVVTS